jgi:hypothetical protein
MIAKLFPPIREPLSQQLPVASVLVSNSMKQLTEMGQTLSEQIVSVPDFFRGVLFLISHLPPNPRRIWNFDLLTLLSFFLASLALQLHSLPSLAVLKREKE